MLDTVLVTGGAGFIGSHVCECLLREKINVICIDNINSYYNPDFKIKNISAVRVTKEVLGPAGAAFIFLKGDIRDKELVDQTFSRYKPDAVIHLAACAGVRPSIEDPVQYIDVNINGTVNILEAIRKHGVKVHIFASSSSVYGNNRKVPFSEEDFVDKPISPYAATKKAGELICHTYHHLYGINTACLRFFTVYGPRQRPDLAISKFTGLMLAGKALPVYGDGSFKRDYTYIDDIVDGIIRALHWADDQEGGLGCCCEDLVDEDNVPGDGSSLEREFLGCSGVGSGCSRVGSGCSRVGSGCCRVESDCGRVGSDCGRVGSGCFGEGPLCNGSKFEVFNLGGSHTVSLLEMIEVLENALKMKAQLQFLPPQPGDVETTFADISKAGRILGYKPAASFSEGIRKFVDWYDKHRKNM